MAVEKLDRFEEWYQENRYVIESNLGGYCLLRKDIFVECGRLHEERVGNYVLKIVPTILEDYSDGLRSLCAEFIVSLENTRGKPHILCCDKRVINKGESFYVPTTDNFSLFKLREIYADNNSVWIGPQQFGAPIGYKY